MRQGLKSLTEYFGKQKIRTIQHGDIEALKLHLIRKPTRAGQKTDGGGGSQGASVSSGGVEFCFSERLDESSPFGAANGKKLINLSAEKIGPSAEITALKRVGGVAGRRSRPPASETSTYPPF